MKVSCSRCFSFDTAHRVLGHEGACANLHGHGYRVEITAEADHLDTLGRVIDFGVLKEKIGAWIKTYWDHNTILFQEDTMLLQALEPVAVTKPVFVSAFNPTAENMAMFLLTEICPQVLANTGITVTHIKLWETANCYATAVL